jgi:hypothetical protein
MKTDHPYENIGKFTIIATAVVLFWRGVWLLADIVLFPNNMQISAIISFTVGLAILLIMRTSLSNLF